MVKMWTPDPTVEFQRSRHVLELNRQIDEAIMMKLRYCRPIPFMQIELCDVLKQLSRNHWTENTTLNKRMIEGFFDYKTLRSRTPEYLWHPMDQTVYELSDVGRSHIKVIRTRAVSAIQQAFNAEKKGLPTYRVKFTQSSST